MCHQKPHFKAPRRPRLLLIGEAVTLVKTVDHGRAVWMSYMILGAILMIAGFFALRARYAKDAA